jgi:hypothetical protein
VWIASLEAEEARRSGKHEGMQTRSSPKPGYRKPVDAPREAAYRLKVALDAARDSLNAERAQTARVTRLLGEAVQVLEEQQRLAKRQEILTDGYSDALTSLLGPSDTSQIDN